MYTPKTKYPIFLFILRVAVAFILIQTLYFKFSAHPDSVYIFSTVGLEPFGRIGIGILELIAAILIMLPRFIGLGSLLSAGIISGAVFMHLTLLGIDVNDDGGLLFYMAVFVLVGSLYLLSTYRYTLPFIGQRLITRQTN